MSALSPQQVSSLMAPVWPALAVLGPALVYLVLVGAVLDGLAPADGLARSMTIGIETIAPSAQEAVGETAPEGASAEPAPQSATETASPPTTPVVVREVAARVEFGLACLVFSAAAIVTLGYALAGITARQGWTAGGIALGLTGVFALFVFFSDTGTQMEMVEGGRLATLAPFQPILGSFSPGIQDDLRDVIVTRALTAARAEGLHAEVVWHALLLAALVSALGVATTVALVLRFAEIAWPARPDDGEIEGLRQRWRSLRVTLLLGAVVLTLAVIGTRSFYHWPLSMVDPATAAGLEPLVQTGAAVWGTIFTLLLIATALPALVALRLEIDAAADDHAIDHKGRKAWRETHGLLLAPQTALSGVLAAATPLLATPTLEALTTLFN
ncbi:MAG: hypothetical protein AAFQ88_08820 [Pseudomonadota bacterium]